MRERGFEGRWVPVEAERYHGDVEREQDEVEDEEATAYCVSTVEIVWYYIVRLVSLLLASSNAHIPARMTLAS
jgi:hypothetical protein